MVEVTTQDALKFCEVAMRNWGHVRFTKADLEDLRAELARHREAAVAEKDAEIARLREALSAILEGTYVGREDRPVRLKSRWGHYEARLYHKARAALSNPSSSG